MTPSVIIVPPMEVEQSNQLLREMKEILEYMVRVNIMDENQKEVFFNHENYDHILDTFIRPAIKDLDFCGIHTKFLNYSAS